MMHRPQPRFGYKPKLIEVGTTVLYKGDNKALLVNNKPDVGQVVDGPLSASFLGIKVVPGLDNFWKVKWTNYNRIDVWVWEQSLEVTTV